MFRSFPYSWRLAEAINAYQESLPVYTRAELGVSPESELVYVDSVDAASRKRYTLRRGGTARTSRSGRRRVS